MNLSDLHLLRPLWLLALIPWALGVWHLARSNATTPVWRDLVDAHLLPHLLDTQESPAQRLLLWLLAIGGLLGILALAGPVWRHLPQPAYQTEAQRVIVLDISESMNAADLPPSRLAHARFEILDLLKHLREGQTALIAYGAEPFVVSPLTGDTKTIAAQVPQLSTGLLPVEGAKRTDLALKAADRLLTQAGSRDGEVILVTDGLDQPAASLEAAQQLRRNGYRLSVLGVGSLAGAPIPKAEGGFRQTADGRPQLTKLDEQALPPLAAAGGGKYVTATPDDRDIEALDLEHVHKRLAEDTSNTTTLADQWREEGPWLLLLLLPLAAAGFRRGWLGPLVLVVMIAPTPQAQASVWSDLWHRPDQQAVGLLEAGDPQAAAQRFERPDWRAAAAYQAGQYDKALEDLSDPKSARSWYNRGNTLAKMGEYQQAIDAYDQALAENPDDADAQYNRDLVEQLMKLQNQSSSQQQSGSPEGDDQSQKSDQSQDSAQSNQEQSEEQQSGEKQSSQEQSGQTSDQTSSAQQNPADQNGQQNTASNEKDPQSSDDGTSSTPQSDEQTGDAREQSTTASDQSKQDEPQPDSQSPNGQMTGSDQDQATSDSNPNQAGDQEPGLADLLNQKSPGASDKPTSAGEKISSVQPMTEAEQAMEHQLNRVPDDPGGLLRQRFLLQHLRRTGQLK
ncbi:MAG: VWA domain-containing protein [Candidatus Thiodiazotropha sp.]